LVEEGDTVPAGLHIRMDFESGQKWARLDIDEDGTVDDKNDGEDVNVVNVDIPPLEERSSSSVIVDTSGSVSVIVPFSNNDDTITANKDNNPIKITHLPSRPEVTPEQSSIITSQLLDQERQKQKQKAKASIAALNDYPQGDDADSDEEDVDMMYRALSSLPTIEIERMGRLPLRPTNNNGSNNDKTTDEYQEFERIIRELWATRQSELKQMEEEFMADAPDLLRARIASLTNYIVDPVAQIKQYKSNDTNTDTEDEEDNSDSTTKEEEEDIVWVLGDL